MAEINWAHEQLRVSERRHAYDRGRRRAFDVGGQDAPGQAGPRATATAAARRDEGPRTGVLDFGRYAGVSIAELARRDPDYLRWLCRHSSGLRFREQIQRILPADPDLSRRANTVA